ncbi:hypothetical protein PVK06_024538 [Gossypium arboreum]|uniref:Uncharacterized protein n=1 Tax=Gossypium arboreum TaxID=29729 RepID=A0ABR0PE00_GOSAR|nr:hypothetical protein PVK06_024538 [Gossypium arboreum]
MQAEVMTPMEEVVHDAPNTDHENHCIFINHFELDDNSQQEFGNGGHEKTLNRVEGIFDPINIEIDVAIEALTHLLLLKLALLGHELFFYETHFFLHLNYVALEGKKFVAVEMPDLAK